MEAVAVCFLFSFLQPRRTSSASPRSSARSSPRRSCRSPRRCCRSTASTSASRRSRSTRSSARRSPTYVRRLEEELRALDVRTGLHLMTSASGVSTARARSQRPVNLLMSGPVAGVVGGIWVGRQAGFQNVITLDVGGTSADIGLVAGRQAAHEAPARHARRPLPGDDPDGRRRHDRRRRRLDRLRRRRRHLPLRARARRARSPVRPPTTAAAPSRPRPTRWSTSAGCCPRTSSAGRWS